MHSTILWRLVLALIRNIDKTILSISKVIWLPVCCIGEEFKLVETLESSWSRISILISWRLELSIIELIPDEIQHLFRVLILKTVTIRLDTKLEILVNIAIGSVHPEGNKCIIDRLLIMWRHNSIIFTTNHNHSSFTWLKIAEWVDQWWIIVMQLIQLLQSVFCYFLSIKSFKLAESNIKAWTFAAACTFPSVWHR